MNREASFYQCPDQTGAEIDQVPGLVGADRNGWSWLAGGHHTDSSTDWYGTQNEAWVA